MKLSQKTKLTQKRKNTTKLLEGFEKDKLAQDIRALNIQAGWR